MRKRANSRVSWCAVEGLIMMGSGFLLVLPFLQGPAAGQPPNVWDTVRVELGTVNNEQGLRQVDHQPIHVSRVMTMGGRECRATNLKE